MRLHNGLAMPSYMGDLIEQMKKKKAGVADSKAEEEKEQKKQKIIEALKRMPEGEAQRKAAPAEIEPFKPAKIFTKIVIPRESVKEPSPRKKPEAVKETEQEALEVAPATEQRLPVKTAKSKTEKQMEQAEKEEIDSYGNIKIYRVEGEPLLYYWTPVPRSAGTEKTIINTIKEAATRIISITPYKIRDPEQKRNVYYQRIMEIIRSSPELNIPASRFDFYADAVVREMVGYGMIDPLVNDDKLEEIMVIGQGQPVYVFHRQYEMMTTNIEFFSDQEIIDLVNRIARQVGRRIDISAPLLDARLPDGSRVNATIPPASVSGATLTIRKFRGDPFSMIDLIKMNTVTLEASAFLWACVEGMGVKPANIVISGGTGSGKTTTLNVLASFIPRHERIISIEDTAELNLPLKHWIRFEGRPPGIEGTGEISLDILTKNSLRMRPDRIIVGEIRHDEAFSLFTAMNTGHDGATTGDTLIQFSNGNIEEIGNFVENKFMEKNPLKEGDFEFVDIKGEIFVPSFNKKTFKIEDNPVIRVWRKNARQKIRRIKTKSGKEIRLTEDHPIYRINNGIQEINAEEAKKGDFIAFPKQIPINASEEIIKPYLMGLIYGDGHIHSEGIQFVNKEPSLIQSFERGIGEVTKNKISIKDFGGFSRVNVYDKKLVKKIVNEYDIPLGNKTKIFELNKKVLTASQSGLGKLIRGLFDADAHVNLHSQSIQFSTSNPRIARKLPMIIQRFGIHSSLNTQERDGKGKIGPYYRVSIYGKDNLEKFANKIGFGHAEKSKKLEKLILSSKNAKDLFPKISALIRKARNDASMTQTELASLMGTQTRSTIEAYETNKRSPSRNQLEKIANITANTSMGKEVLMLVNSDFRFEEIVKIEEEEFNGYMYDLTVKDNHNYIANGLFVSNCLGTVHANSPEETIVRITSPPMNVPEIMMSGLDFIIVEHRLHDKKKGTIRRITEISEVYGVLEGKTKTQAIFEYDAATDSLKRTSAPVNYLKVLERFTGMQRKQIEAEIKEREKVLKKLVETDVRDINRVSTECEKYLLSRGGKRAFN